MKNLLQYTCAANAGLVLILSLLPHTVSAQMIAAPGPQAKESSPAFSGTYASSTTDYKLDNHLPDIDRKMLGGDGSFAITPAADLFVQAAYILDDEFSSANTADGTGFMIGFGSRMEIYRQDNVTVTGYGLINSFSEQFRGQGKYDDLKVSGSIFEFRFGGTASTAINPNISPYAGLELTPYSKGKFKFSTPVEALSFNIRKDSILALQLGAVLRLGNIVLRPAMSILGEQSFLISVMSH